MKKSIKKAFLIMAGIILCIVVLVGIYIYRNVHVDIEVFYRIDRMDSKEDIPELVKIFSNRWNPWMVRHAALEQLSVIDSAPAAVEPLIKILQSGWQFPDFRTEVAFTLGCLGDKKAIEPLIEALEYGPEIKQAALQGLGFIEVRDERVANVARELLNDESEIIRDLAIIALGVHGGEEEVDLLIEQLRNGDSGERSNAADALGKIGSKRAVEPLIERLKNDTEYVTWRCCIALLAG